MIKITLLLTFIIAVLFGLNRFSENERNLFQIKEAKEAKVKETLKDNYELCIKSGYPNILEVNNDDKTGKDYYCSNNQKTIKVELLTKEKQLIE